MHNVYEGITERSQASSHDRCVIDVYVCMYICIVIDSCVID